MAQVGGKALEIKLNGFYRLFPPKKPRTRIALTRNNHILLVRNVVDPVWTLPGGGYHHGETGAECAVREVQEELGVHIQPEAMRPIGPYRETRHRITWDYDCFQATCPKNAAIRPGLELLEAKWFPYSSVPANASGLVTFALKALS